eukprot:scaffold136968_cov21-Tisochrysis_lutea.AAC.2
MQGVLLAARQMTSHAAATAPALTHFLTSCRSRACQCCKRCAPRAAAGALAAAAAAAALAAA